MEKKLGLSAKILYLCLAVSTFNPFIYTTALQPVLVKLTLAAGAILIVARLIRYKGYMKMPCAILMALFCISFAFSAFMNREYDLVGNGKWIVWTGIQFFALYMCDVERDVREYRKEFNIISHLMIIYNLAGCLISLGMLVTAYSKMFQTPEGEMIVSGFTWGRLWGIHSDPNYGAVFSVIVMVLSLLFFLKKRGVVRAFYIVSIVLNFLYLVFSDSRTGEIALVCSMGLFVYMALIRRLSGREKAVRFGIALLAVVLLAGLSLGSARLIKREYNRKMAPVFAEMFPKKKVPGKPGKKPAVGRKQDLKTDVSNGRFDIWKSGLEVWKTSPVYGTGYTSFVPYTKEHVPDTYVVNTGGSDYVSLHNSFMNTLAYQGIIGIVLLVAIAGSIILYVLRPVFRSEGDDYLDMGAMLSCVGAVAVSMMFLLEGTYTNSPGAFVLWSFSGYMVQYAYQVRKGS